MFFHLLKSRIPLSIRILFCGQESCFAILDGARIAVEEAKSRFEGVQDVPQKNVRVRIDTVLTHLHQLLKMLNTVINLDYMSINNKRIYLSKLVKQSYEMQKLSFATIA
jgi:hypothetical protein